MDELGGVDDPAAVLDILSPERGSADKETAMAAPGGGSGADGKGPTEKVPFKAPPAFTAHAFVFGDLNTPGAFVRPKRRHRKGDPADCVAACCAPPTAMMPPS